MWESRLRGVRACRIFVDTCACVANGQIDRHCLCEAFNDSLIHGYNSKVLYIVPCTNNTKGYANIQPRTCTLETNESLLGKFGDRKQPGRTDTEIFATPLNCRSTLKRKTTKSGNWLERSTLQAEDCMEWKYGMFNSL